MVLYVIIAKEDIAPGVAAIVVSVVKKIK